MSKKLFDGAKITRVPYAKITCVPSPVHGLPYAKITRVRGYSRMQKLHAINNFHYQANLFQRKPATNSALPGALRGGRGTVL